MLELEHWKSRLGTVEEPKSAKMQLMVDTLQAWIDGQRLHFIVEVNVGAWSGKSTREMAEQAGLLDFYNYVYTPFSQCAHSTWLHVGRLNSGLSELPDLACCGFPKSLKSIPTLRSCSWRQNT